MFMYCLNFLISGIIVLTIALSLVSLLKSLLVVILFLHSAQPAGLYNLLFLSAQSKQKICPQSLTQHGSSIYSRQIGHFRNSNIPSITVSAQSPSSSSNDIVLGPSASACLIISCNSFDIRRGFIFLDATVHPDYEDCELNNIISDLIRIVYL